MPIKKAYADTPAGQMHYRFVLGEGIPLVFYHRTPATSASFETMMALMAGERPLYAFDTPGFGESFLPEGCPDTAQYGSYYLAALDALALNEIHVFAHHTGTHFATEMAAAAPGRVKSLSLNGIAYLTAQERADFAATMSHPVPPDAEGKYFTRTWSIIKGLFPKFDPKLTHREFVSALYSMDGRELAHGAIWEQDYPAVFARVTCPVLAMCAKDDTLRPYLDRVSQAHPEIKSVVTGPAKYFSPEYDAQRTVDELRAFLLQVEETPN